MCKKVCGFLSIILISLFLTACFDSNEIGDFSYTSIMGIEEGEIDKYKFTFQLPIFSMSGQGGEGGGGKEEKSANLMTIEAPSLISAVQMANTSVSKKLNFMHLKAIVISEDLAVSGKVGEYIAPLLRYNQIRRTTVIIICKGKAQEFVEAIKPYSGELVTQTIEELMKKSRETGYFPNITLNDFYDGLKAPYHALLGIYGAVNEEADTKSKDSKSQEDDKQSQSDDSKDAAQEDNKGVEGDKNAGESGAAGGKKEDKAKPGGEYYAGDIPRKGGEKIELFGSTLFDGDKMVGKLTGVETQMLLLARGELKVAPITIADPKEPEQLVSFEITEFEKPQINIDMTDVNKPKIHLKIRLEGNIISIQSSINYESTENKKLIEGALEKHLVSGIEKTFAKCKELKTDVFNFGTVAVKHFLTIPQWEEYNWLSKFPASELKTEVDFTVRSTGQLIKTVPMFSTEGKQ